MAVRMIAQPQVRVLEPDQISSDLAAQDSLQAQDAPTPESVSQSSLQKHSPTLDLLIMSASEVSARGNTAVRGVVRPQIRPTQRHSVGMCAQVLAEEAASAQLAATFLKGISNITSTLAQRYSDTAAVKANETATAANAAGQSQAGQAIKDAPDGAEVERKAIGQVGASTCFCDFHWACPMHDVCQVTILSKQRVTGERVRRVPTQQVLADILQYHLGHVVSYSKDVIGLLAHVHRCCSPQTSSRRQAASPLQGTSSPA